MLSISNLFSQTDFNIIRSLGPYNFSGNMLSIAVRDGNEIWSGSKSGGLWRSSTAGFGKKAWQRILTTPVEAQCVGAIAFDPDNKDFVIVGTGSRNFNGVSFSQAYSENLGGGIFWSDDGGITWTKSNLSEGTLENASVNDLVFDKVEGITHIFAATSDGLYYSDDKGIKFWKISSYADFRNVKIDPITKYIYASCGSLNSKGNQYIIRSKDHGQNFHAIKDCYGRRGPKLDYFISKMSKPLIDVYNNVLYCMTMNPRDGNDPSLVRNGLEAIYRCDNAGEEDNMNMNWELVFDGSKPGNEILGDQGFHVGSILVNPDNTNVVYVGGIGFWRSDDGGKSFTKMSKDQTVIKLKSFPEEGETYEAEHDDIGYMHVDINRIVLDKNSNRLFIATDGGIFTTQDKGLEYMNFEARNGRLITTQFCQSIANGKNDNQETLPPIVQGGLQDNGTLFSVNGQTNWKIIDDGDGGWNAIRYKKVGPNKDQIDNGTTFSEVAGFVIDKFAYGFKVAENISAPVFKVGTGWSYSPVPYVYAQEPNLDAIKPGTLYVGTDYVWRSTDDGNTWAKTGRGLVDQLFPTGGASFLAVSPVNASNLIVTGINVAMGLPFNDTYYSINGGNSWTKSNFSAGKSVSCICFDYSKPNIAYATVAYYNGDCVWKTTDGGATWNNIVSSTIWGKNGNPYAICVDPYNPDILWIGTNNSLLIYDQTTRELTNWFDIPTYNTFYWTKKAGVWVSDIKVVDYGRGIKHLRIATYGNGVFELANTPLVAMGDFFPQPLPPPNPLPDGSSHNNPIRLELKMKTRGWSTLEEQTVMAEGEYNWSINGRIQTPVRWNGTAQPYTANTVSTASSASTDNSLAENILGTLTLELNEVDTIRIWRSVYVSGFNYKPTAADTMVFVINANDYYYSTTAGSYSSTTAKASVSNAENSNLLSGNSMLAAYPNPFSQSTTIKYQIPASGNVSLKIYDIAGREVETLLNSIKPAGKYQTVWNAEKATSGMYYIVVKCGAYTAKQKLQVVK